MSRDDHGMGLQRLLRRVGGSGERGGDKQG
jgi:hypothetical protein